MSGWEGMSFCTACGRPRTGTSRFCNGCGTEFRDQQQDQPRGTVTNPDAFRETMTSYPGPPVAEPPHAAPTYPGASYAEPAHGPVSRAPSYAGRESYPGPASRPPGGPPGRRNRLIAVIAAVIVLGAAGGAYALVASHGHGKAAAQPTATASIAASQAAPVSSAPASPTASSATGAAVASGGASNPAAGGATNPAAQVVVVAPAAAGNSAAPQVTSLVDRYFTAINQHDYAAYASLLDPQMQQQNPQSSFDSGYATTTDSAETLTGISGTGSGGLAASLTFTSQQSPADSPDNSSCDQWSITLFLVPNGTGYLIGPPPSSYRASYQAC
jgi:hypothetical protein